MGLGTAMVVLAMEWKLGWYFPITQKTSKFYSKEDEMFCYSEKKAISHQ